MLKIRSSRIFWFSCFLIFFGCGSDSDMNNFPSQSFPVNNMAGTWKGTASSNVANGNNNITLVLLQTGVEVSGSYTCATGTAACARPVGNFSAHVSRSTLTGGVVFVDVVPKGPSCSLHGTFTETTLSAQYSCNVLANDDQGEWNLIKQD